jgi:hypothetical protein
MAMNETRGVPGLVGSRGGQYVKLLEALPAAKYDFRHDAEGRSLGELAWHLAEGDAIT